MPENTVRKLPNWVNRHTALFSISFGIISVVFFIGTSPLTKQQPLAGFLTLPSNMILPPTNLGDQAYYINGANQSTLTWSPSSNAVSYNIYENNVMIASNITIDSYTIPSSKALLDTSYYVTAVDAQGDESIPSAILPNLVDAANFTTNTNPGTPPGGSYYGTHLTVTPEWNNGSPRMNITWTGVSSGPSTNSPTTYSMYATIYRDGVRLPGNITTNRYIDDNVQPGVSYSYTVALVNQTSPSAVYIGAQSASASATALSGPPAFSTTPVTITRVVPDNDSMKVFFNTVPGAVDYRVYDVDDPTDVKYAGLYGTGTYGDMAKNGVTPILPPSEEDIEVNGVPAGADLVVEAVDKAGPYQEMDGTMGPGSMTGPMSINGQGDPSDVPNVIARSGIFKAVFTPTELTGSQVFFDNFQNEPPLQPATEDPNIAAAQPNSAYNEILTQKNKNWTITSYGADVSMTSDFFDNNHFMDILYDGPTYNHGSPFSHNNNSSNVLEPNQTADISGGKVLHVTFEVDPHFDARRWVEVLVGGGGQSLLYGDPTKLNSTQSPTSDGYLFEWQIGGDRSDNDFIDFYYPQFTTPGGTIQPNGTFTTGANGQPDGHEVDDVIENPCPNTNRDEEAQVFNQLGENAYADGSALNLDNRAKYDLYLSSNHFKVVETFPDDKYQLTCEGNFPTGLSLPWNQLQVYYDHELYHTGNDINEQRWEYWDNNYFYSYEPYSDERHWDNMGFEVLPNFSTDDVALPASQPPTFVSGQTNPVATSLSFGSVPVTATAGNQFTMTLTAKDASGNTVTGYTGTVHFTSSDPQAVLPANYTFTSADNGAHSFTFTLKTPGSQTVTATDTASSGIMGSVNGISVSAQVGSTATLCLNLGATPNTASSLTVNDTAGNQIFTDSNLSTTNNEIQITDQSLVIKLSNSKAYDMTITPAGYVPLTLNNVSSVLSSCSALPSGENLIPGDFNGNGIIDLTDLVTTIRAYNQTTPDSSTQLAFQVFGGRPTLPDIVTMIRNYQLFNH